jgi:hypothetical protein
MAGEILRNPARGGELSILGRGHDASQAQTIRRGNRHMQPLAFLASRFRSRQRPRHVKS